MTSLSSDRRRWTNWSAALVGSHVRFNLHSSLVAVLITVAAGLSNSPDLSINTKKSDVLRGPIDCFECSTYGQDPMTSLCADPFNRTAAIASAMAVAKCHGACAKWLHQPLQSEVPNVVRTCSTRLNIKMQFSLVCMDESKSDSEYGRLCFCQRDRCNSSPSSHVASYRRIGRWAIIGAIADCSGSVMTAVAVSFLFADVLATRTRFF